MELRAKVPIENLMIEATLRYEGGYRCSAIHGPSGTRLATDAPKDNLGKGEAFSPTDLTATSLASCMLTTMALVATKSGLDLPLEGSEATVRKFMTAEPPRRIARLEVELRIPIPASSAHRELLEKAAIHCPVALSLHPDVEKAVGFKWTS